MFEVLTRRPEDPLLALIGQFRADPRPAKVDLGVGVYRDEQGITPVPRAVKAAERMLLEAQTTKSYVGPAGDENFLECFRALVTGDVVDARRVVGVQTVGGSGALCLAADVVRRSGCSRVWVGAPTWPNHTAIFEAAGLEVHEYPIFDVASQTVLFGRMIDALSAAGRGDVALLQAGCHNPTGMPISDEQWRELTTLVVDRGIVPLIDLAYQGLGRSLPQDVAGLRRMIANVPEALIAASASKIFGLYRERTGAIYAVTASRGAADVVRSHLLAAARVTYSMPPDHGAAVVRTILEDSNLRADWVDELDAMRRRIVRLRTAAAGAASAFVPALGAIGSQEGLFSLLDLAPERISRLRDECGIYIPASGRINIAGLKEADAAAVMAKVVGQ